MITFLHAAPIINPSLPALIEEGFAIRDTQMTNPQCGFIGDCLFEKKMHKRGHKVRITGVSESGTLVFSIAERFNIQAEIGSAQYSWKLDHRHLKIKGGILWSVDAKLIIFNVRDFNFALDAKLGGFDTDGSHLRYWQVSPAFSYRVGIFTPYAGCAINRTTGKLLGIEKTLWIHEDQHLGPFVGLSYSRGNWFLANFEWRDLFEEGASILFQVRF